jgi:hypothetical protein
LGFGKMEKPEPDSSGTILQMSQEAAPATEADITTNDLTLKNNGITGFYSGYRCDAGSVFIAKWKMEQYVLQAGHANFA